MNDRITTLVTRNFGRAGSELHVDGCPIGRIADEFGTPLYVYSAAVLDAAWRRLRDALPDDFTICYSVKANPNPAILRFLVERNCGLEIASAGELYLAQAAGAASESIVFAGPGKLDAELEMALKERIGEIHVESITEIRRLAAIAARLGVRAPVALRINPGPAALGGAMRMGGRPGPFGIDEEDLETTAEAIVAEPHCDLRGLHLFAGTQILDAAVLIAQYQAGLEIGDRLARSLRRPLVTVDFGGGFGIPYFPGERQLDLDRLRTGLRTAMAAARANPAFAGTRFVVEPGRYLVGEAGLYVARVIDVKTSRGQTFAIVDGGMHHHLAASGNLGQVIKRSFPVAILNRLGEMPGGPVEVVGPLCTPLDVVARDAELPPVVVGDLLGIFQSGAYARTASPLTFLSHPTPPEVLVEAGHPRLIRRRGRLDDLVADLTEVHRP